MSISNATPVYAVPEENLVPVSGHLRALTNVTQSRMFLINKWLRGYREKNPSSPMYDASQGDGGASLPGVPRQILEAAARRQVERGCSYNMSYGTDEYRQIVVEEYWKLDPSLGWGPKNVLASAGGRDALVKAYQATLHLGHGREGDVLIVSRVPWISYNWGPYGIGANVMWAPGDPEQGWMYSEDAIRECARFAALSGRKIAGLVITNPDNPTGLTLSTEKMASLARCALEVEAAFVIFDWMYHYVTDEKPNDLNAFLKLFSPEERKRLIFMDGITKSLGASNVRNGHLLADENVIEFIAARASHTVLPSFYSLAVAMEAYQMGYAEASKSIVGPTNASRVVLKDLLEKSGLRYILGKGYYAFIHVADYIRAGNFADSDPFAQYLAEQHGVAVVPGVFFSPFGSDWIRFSYATPVENTRGAFARLMDGLESLRSR